MCVQRRRAHLTDCAQQAGAAIEAILTHIVNNRAIEVVTRETRRSQNWTLLGVIIIVVLVLVLVLGASIASIYGRHIAANAKKTLVQIPLQLWVVYNCPMATVHSMDLPCRSTRYTSYSRANHSWIQNWRPRKHCDKLDPKELPQRLTTWRFVVNLKLEFSKSDTPTYSYRAATGKEQYRIGQFGHEQAKNSYSNQDEVEVLQAIRTHREQHR